MRWMMAICCGIMAMVLPLPVAQAKDKSDQVLNGVLSGLLGGSPQSSDAAYTAKERERLASLLQSGEYATSRQGEPIDTIVYGIPLTRSNRVYTATPITPTPQQPDAQ